MGVDVAGFNFILDNKERIKGKVLHIGRQGLHYAGSYTDASGVKGAFSDMLLKKHGLNFKSIDTWNGGDGHTEKLFMMLGADQVESIDYSPYERATIIHDLNNPVPQELHGQFDFILDCGTLEHIFDVRMVIQNIKDMLKVGGTYCVVTNTNNFIGHGFYQFSPEFFRTVFSEEAGYKINSLQIYELFDKDPYFFVLDIPPPPFKGARQEMTANTPNGLYICVSVDKISETGYTKNYQQSDYLKIWGEI